MPIAQHGLTVSQECPEGNLDELRALAACCVAGDHVVQLWIHNVRFMEIWELGRIGVLLFVLHTSLVLMSSMERRVRDGRWVAAFYIRRACRSYPLAIACMQSYDAFQGPESVRDFVHPTQFVRLPPWHMFYNLALVQSLAGSPLVVRSDTVAAHMPRRLAW